MTQIGGAGALGQGAVGFGIGMSAAIALVQKDTEAWVGNSAVVNAKGNDTLDFPTQTTAGLEVQAKSTENVFNLAVAGGSGPVFGVAGSAGVALVASDTAAFIDQKAQVNLDRAGVSADQTVNVTASNDSQAYGLPVNLASGAITLGGGIDIGVFHNDTMAAVQAGAEVHAAKDIDIASTSNIVVNSFVGAIADPGLFGLAATASLYSIRGNFQDGTVFAVIPVPISDLNAVNGTKLQDQLDTLIFGLTSDAGGGLDAILGAFAKETPTAGTIRDALTQAPLNPVSGAVTDALPGTGTTATVSGARLFADTGDVNVTAQETTHLAQDTTWTFAQVPGDDDALLALANNRSVSSAKSIAVATINGGATVTAGGDINVTGDVDNNELLASTTTFADVENTVGAHVDGLAMTGNPMLTFTPNATGGDTIARAAGSWTADGFQAGQTITVTGSTGNDGAYTIASISADGSTLTLTQDGVLTAETHDGIAVSAGSTLTAGGNVNLNAHNHTFAAGYSILPSFGTVATMTADTNYQHTVQSAVTNSSTITAGGSVGIQAKDDSTALVVADAIALKKDGKGLAVAQSTNKIANTIGAAVEGSTVHANGGDVTVVATSNPTITAIAVGVAVGGGGSTLAGSLSTNEIDNTIDAHVSGTPDPANAMVLHGSDVTATGAVHIQALDGGTIVAASGNASIANGKFAGGAAVALNTISSDTRAYVDHSTVTADTVEVLGQTNIDLDAVTVGGTLANDFVLGGSVSSNQIMGTLDAHVSGGSVVNGTTQVSVHTQDDTNITAVAGEAALATSSSSHSIGAAVSTNTITRTETAGVDGANTTVTGNTIEVQATNDAVINAITVGGQGADGSAFGGSVSVNNIGGTLDVYLTGGAHATAVQSLTLLADDKTQINAVAGLAAVTTGSGSAAFGAALSTNNITRAVSVRVEGGMTVAGGTTVEVLAKGEANVNAIAIGAEKADTFAAGGSIPLNTIGGSVDAHVSGGATITAGTMAQVWASDDTLIFAAGGQAAVSTNSGGAIGAALSTNTITRNTTGYVDGGSVSGDTIEVLATTAPASTRSRRGAPGPRTSPWPGRSRSTRSAARWTRTPPAGRCSTARRGSPSTPATTPAPPPSPARWPLPAAPGPPSASRCPPTPLPAPPAPAFRAARRTRTRSRCWRRATGKSRPSPSAPTTPRT